MSGRIRAGPAEAGPTWNHHRDALPRKLSYAALALAAVWFGRTYFEVAEAKRVERRQRLRESDPVVPAEPAPEESLPIYAWLASDGGS